MGMSFTPSGKDALIELFHLFVNALERGPFLRTFNISTLPWMTSGSSTITPSARWVALAMVSQSNSGTHLDDRDVLERESAVPFFCHQTVCSISCRLR